MNQYVTLNYKSIASMVQIAGLLLFGCKLASPSSHDFLPLP